jgi:hypothetical protein
MTAVGFFGEIDEGGDTTRGLKLMTALCKALNHYRPPSAEPLIVAGLKVSRHQVNCDLVCGEKRTVHAKHYRA